MMRLIAALLCLATAPTGDEVTLVDFGEAALPDFVVLNNTTLARVPHEGGYAARVRFGCVDWPNVSFRAPAETWDWSGYEGVAVSLYNPGETSVTAALRVDNAGADGTQHCNNASVSVPAGKRAVLSLCFNTGEDEFLWGMRGVPIRSPLGSGPVLDTAHITAFQVFLPRPQQEYELLFERAWLFGEGGRMEERLPLPFIDRFGQYKHGDWPGKLKEEGELAERIEAEGKDLESRPALPGRDAWGGWAAGPQLEATGWFRAEQVDGKWWLVTPGGRLFFSNGMDCVGTWQRTFVEERESWFEWLAGSDEPPYQRLFQKVSNAHSGAERIGGKGRAFGFYAANLIRKYGEEWPVRWRDTTYARLKSWGFNTIANWSQHDVLEHSPLPYVVSASVSGVPPIEGSTGYWAQMKDVYHADFAPRAEAGLERLSAHRDKPHCLGYFVDNELAWEGVTRGTLASPPEQPCRVALIRQLKDRYGDIGALNTAWDTQAADWDTLRAPDAPNAAAQADLDAYLYGFARRYFEVIKAAGRKHAPHQLYLGCRFSTAPQAAVRACADVADVVSYNVYSPCLPETRAAEMAALGKPVVIGEFHFGALDRGMFHTGLVATADQDDRAQHYVDYVRSVADHPALVGCHWFQYVDEPNTGRWYDGENYNIGFVDVTDTPYPEMVEAARAVHAEVYERRYGGMDGDAG